MDYSRTTVNEKFESVPRVVIGSIVALDKRYLHWFWVDGLAGQVGQVFADNTFQFDSCERYFTVHSKPKSVEINWFAVDVHYFSIKTEPLKWVSGSNVTENQ